MKTKIVPEMQKLRDYLDKNNIAWEDKSEYYDRLDAFCDSGVEPYEDIISICRTHFYYNEHFVSVINGFGTYGGYNLFEKENDGLLEIMIDHNEPIGYLSFEEVITLIITLLKSK